MPSASPATVLLRCVAVALLWLAWSAAAAPAAPAAPPAGRAPSLSSPSNLTTTVPALPDASFSVIRVFGALVLVLALFLAGVWLFKNWQRLALHRGRSAHLQVIEMKPLGGKHVLYVVGYQHQRMLLAASPSGVALLSHLPTADAGELEPSQVDSPNFVEALQQAVHGKS